MRWSAIALVGLLLIGLAACADGEDDVPTASPTLVRPLITPSADTPVCAADSALRFLEMQNSAPFDVYCPTFLPEGFVLEQIEFGQAADAPAEGEGAVLAVFQRNDPEARVELVQGRPGVAAIAEFQIAGQDLIGETAYDGFTANLFETGLLARSPDGFTHKIAAQGLTTNDIIQIAAAMQPLTGEASPSPTP
jgi:hypothetical protein